MTFSFRHLNPDNLDIPLPELEQVSEEEEPAEEERITSPIGGSTCDEQPKEV